MRYLDSAIGFGPVCCLSVAYRAGPGLGQDEE
jgi:hypothetical protein